MDTREAGDLEGRLPTNRRKCTRFISAVAPAACTTTGLWVTTRVASPRRFFPKRAKSEWLISFVTRRGLNCIAGTRTRVGVGSYLVVGACALRAKSNVTLALIRSQHKRECNRHCEETMKWTGDGQKKSAKKTFSTLINAFFCWSLKVKQSSSGFVGSSGAYPSCELWTHLRACHPLYRIENSM